MGVCLVQLVTETTKWLWAFLGQLARFWSILLLRENQLCGPSELPSRIQSLLTWAAKLTSAHLGVRLRVTAETLPYSFWAQLLSFPKRGHFLHLDSLVLSGLGND